jgi:hypothetical protein
MRSKSFALGFVVGFALLFAANYYSYTQMQNSFCDDCFISFGFPFEVWIEGGFVTIRRIVWSGVVANTAITVCVSFILGWVVEKISKSRSRLP